MSLIAKRAEKRVIDEALKRIRIGVFEIILARSAFG